jgi:hypothetical protein
MQVYGKHFSLLFKHNLASLYFARLAMRYNPSLERWDLDEKLTPETVDLAVCAV